MVFILNVSVDALLVDYAIMLSIVGIVSTFVGQTAVNYLVRRYNRSSFIIGSIAAVLVVATIMLTISGILETISDVNNGRTLGFASPC